ncbi:alpha-N-acetylglucosaminidase [Streptomyces sp. NPDC050560]|uniref:alpha-N-acetylglucosaminidase n=1 Tax=Streptomyces sp. NPDC050560 TaxID=3365630 RepID=UPI0037BD9921
MAAPYRQKAVAGAAVPPSRRALLGAAGLLGAGLALGAGSSAAAAPDPMAAARAALRRLLPRHQGQFTCEALPVADGVQRFRVDGAAGRLTVAATSPATALTGVHQYLKRAVGAHVTWGGEVPALPRTLPAPAAPVEGSTALPHRFALNDTNDGYTAPYADWPYWERLIDVLALHGVNEVLVIAGTEAVYRRLLTESGYGDADARAWLPAPSHQPWWLLQNLYGYGGPLSADVVAARADLGRRITGRLRELGMAPVLPGYYGHVPTDFAERAGGDARVVPQGTWHGFERPGWLDPRTDSYARTAAAFYRLQAELLGPAAHFKMDLLHEGGLSGGVPVADAARGVQKALLTARPDATWVILGWEANPLPALLDAVDRERLLIVDGLSDRYPETGERERDWNGTPYAFGTIPNFGGRTTLGARTHLWRERFFAWRDRADSALAGTAYLPEGTERDPAAFELFSELAWQEGPFDGAAWFAGDGGYADYRYGGRDTAARRAWRVLHETAYRHHAVRRSDPHDSLFAARPDLAAERASVYAPPALTYDPARFDAALAALLDVGEPLRDSPGYRYDVVDVARQALTHRARQYLPQLRAAYERGDADTFGALAELWTDLMRLLDELTGTHTAFLLGPWTEAASRFGTTAGESAVFERTARELVTVWGTRATSDAGRLHDYAARDWHGLVGGFHLPRWQRWLDELGAALAEGRQPAAVDWYAVEEPWTRRRGGEATEPSGDPYETAARVRDRLAGAPYQGGLAVRAEPAALPPGGHARVTAEFTNVNGLRATGRVDFTLALPDAGDAAPEGAEALPGVAPAGRGSVSWRVTAPGAPLTEPLRPLPYTLTARYGPQGAERVRAVHEGTLYEAGPLAAGLRTVTTNDAVFGQAGGRFAVNGAGADLWRSTAEFGAVYREGALDDGGLVVLRVDAQEHTGPWARAGIVARAGLADAGSGGFVNLAVTPSNGVVLSWDADGDGLLDTYRRVTGVTAPVVLRLGMADGSYTGEWSRDGERWQPVASAPAGGAGPRDAGLFMTAAGGARGTVEFSGFRVE